MEGRTEAVVRARKSSTSCSEVYFVSKRRHYEDTH